jgi:hypothetical protein
MTRALFTEEIPKTISLDDFTIWFNKQTYLTEYCFVILDKLILGIDPYDSIRNHWEDWIRFDEK